MMTASYVVQAVLAFVFLYSGVSKLIFSRDRLVAKGQTGVARIPAALIRIIGLIEVAGVLGLVLPDLLRETPALPPIAALGLGLIMIPAAVIHYNRKENKAVMFNMILLALSALFMYLRISVVGDAMG